MCREWYMHPNGQLPAYEWSFGDVNPPVHAWASLHVYRAEEQRTGFGDRAFLARVFHKLLLNFSWWVNNKDGDGNYLFEGGFLGMDNIGPVNRSARLPEGWWFEQSDATSWMATYALHLLQIALELARADEAYEDVAAKFVEHFLGIAQASAQFGSASRGIWDEQDGFCYDLVSRHRDDGTVESEFLSPYGIRSMSAAHRDGLAVEIAGEHHGVGYEPGESHTPMFGGNSNWRGPVWFPTNALLVEALHELDTFHGGAFEVELPTGSGRHVPLGAVAADLSRRLSALFLPGPD